MKLFNEFKAFILRGNVIDLAIGIVVGAAFTSVVGAFVKDLITPLIAAIFKQPDFSSLTFTINHSHFLYGDFINVTISFLIDAAVVFFFVVKPMNMLMAMRHNEPPADPTTRDCPYCLNNVPVKAVRCGFCTSDLPAA